MNYFDYLVHSNKNQLLYHIKPVIGPHIKSCKFRRDEIAQTRAAHPFLFDREIQRPRPLCRWCSDALLAVQHVMLECPELDAVRTDVFGRRPTSIAGVLNVAKDLDPCIKF